MFTYQRFLIRQDDHFHIENFPFLEDKIAATQKELLKLPSPNRADMLVSYLKEHCIPSEWVLANPVLAEQIRSKEWPLIDFEDLFESSKGNLQFQAELEAYIREQFRISLVSG